MENNNPPPPALPREIIQVGYDRQAPTPQTSSSVIVVGTHPIVDLRGFTADSESDSGSDDSNNELSENMDNDPAVVQLVGEET